MRPLNLRLKCQMIFLINESPMEIREACAKLEKLRLPLIETQSLLRVGRKLITKYPHLTLTHYAHIVRSEHTQSRCYSRFIKGYESQLNGLMAEYNFIKNNILHTKKINPKPNTKKSSSCSPPKLKKVWLRKGRPKCNVVFTTLRARAPNEWYFDGGCSRHMTSEKSLFTSFEDFNGRNVIFGDDNVARVRNRGSVSIPGCLDLDGVLFVDRLKANLLSISQICDRALGLISPKIYVK